MNPVFAEMVRAHVGDDCHVRAPGGEPAAQNSAAGGLEDRCFDARVAQDGAGSDRARVVSDLDPAARDEYAIGAVVAIPPAVRASACGKQSYGRRLAVRASHDRRRHIVQLAPRHRHFRQRLDGPRSASLRRNRASDWSSSCTWRRSRAAAAATSARNLGTASILGQREAMKAAPLEHGHALRRPSAGHALAGKSIRRMRWLPPWRPR